MCYIIYLFQGDLYNFYRSTYQVLVWMARANAVIQVKTGYTSPSLVLFSIIFDRFLVFLS